MTISLHRSVTALIVVVVASMLVLALSVSAAQAKPSTRQFVKVDHFVVAIPAHPIGQAVAVSTSLDARGNVAGTPVTGSTNGLVIGIGAVVLALLVFGVTYATFRPQPAIADVAALRASRGTPATGESSEDHRKAA